MADDININRDYIDDTSVKEFVTSDDGLIDKYFKDIDVSLRNVGMVGYTTELVSNVSQDTFNASSILFRETFANRAQIPESIYSHAALFQIDDVFSTASSCKFLLVMEESAILDNMEMIDGKGYFYIGKDTTIYVEEKPYVLDYDIRICIAKKGTKSGYEYIFSARYVTMYENSISDVTSPFITVRRSSDGYIALEVQTHQCYRDIRLETILTNTEINYQIIDIPFDGKLAGFDVLYKPPESTDDFSTTADVLYAPSASDDSWYYVTNKSKFSAEELYYNDENKIKQMKTLMVYSQPLVQPFCYYQLLDENTLRITFNTKDRYFMPEFNAELKVILYITEGASGNFDTYDGTNISITPDSESVDYTESYLTAAKPVGASKDGTDQIGIDGVQSLAVEGYRTALALTTDNDLQEYYNNYKYRFGDGHILFIKKRDDVYERVFSAYNIIENSGYIYKTNTLNIDMNIYEMEKMDNNIFVLDPGHLFTIDSNDGFATIYRDETLRDKYYKQYQIDVANKNAEFLDDRNYRDDISSYGDAIPNYLKRNMSFAQWKQWKGYDDKLTIFDISQNIDELEYPEDSNVKYKFKKGYDSLDDPINKKFLVMNPFLIQFTKNPNLISTYMTYVKNEAALDFLGENTNAYVQFIAKTLHVDRAFEKSKRYHLYLNITPSISLEKNSNIVETHMMKTISDYGDEELVETFIPFTENTKYNLAEKYTKNHLRVLAVISKGNENICYTELYPTEYTFSGQIIKFEAYMFTNDHITSDGYLRILPCTVYRDNKGYYYKTVNGDETRYNKYNESNDEIILDSNGKPEVILWDDEDDPDVVTIKKMVDAGELELYSNTKNISRATFINIPISDVNVNIYTLYDLTYIPIPTSQYTINYTDAESGIYYRKSIYDDGYYLAYYISNDEKVCDENGVVQMINETKLQSLLKDGKVVEEQVVNEEGLYQNDPNSSSVTNDFVKFDSSLKGYRVTNMYGTKMEPVTFIKPLNNVRSSLLFKDYTATYEDKNKVRQYKYDVFDSILYSINFIRASEYFNTTTFTYFLDNFLATYKHLVYITEERLRNITAIDDKLYNTYGWSKNFYIGDEEEELDTVNLRITFDMWFIKGTDMQLALPEVKQYIKEQIEKVNDKGTNNLFISNLMRKVEDNFAYVDHIRFKNINYHDSSFQAIKNKVVDINDLSVEERRFYVPELLVIELDDIIINNYYVE